MKTLTLGEKVKIKRGATLFYNLSANSFKVKDGKWTLSQLPEQQAKETKHCYTKRVHFDGDVEVSDPEVIFGEDLRFCEIFINDEPCHLLVEDVIKNSEKNKDKFSPTHWEVKKEKK